MHAHAHSHRVAPRSRAFAIGMVLNVAFIATEVGIG